MNTLVYVIGLILAFALGCWVGKNVEIYIGDDYEDEYLGEQWEEEDYWRDGRFD